MKTHGWLLAEGLVLHCVFWTLVDVGCSAANVDVCTKDQASANALLLLQVRRSAEIDGGRRNLAKTVAEEEAQLDAMASEMSLSNIGTAPSAAGFDRMDLSPPGIQKASGVYEERVEKATPLDGDPSTMVDTARGFAPISVLESIALATTAPPNADTQPGEESDSCSPSCEAGHGLCRNGVCLCRSPYIGETCKDVDLRATRHLAAVRSVKMLTSDPAWAFLLLSEVPLVLATLVVTLCAVGAMLLATFCAHVYFNINAKNNDAFGAEETLAQEDFHEAWLRGKKKHAGAS